MLIPFGAFVVAFPVFAERRFGARPEFDSTECESSERVGALPGRSRGTSGSETDFRVEIIQTLPRNGEINLMHR